MPDDNLATMQTPVTGSRLSRTMKIILAASLALNLGVAGVLIGAAIKFHRDDGPPSAVRDLNYGPFTDALTRDQRKVLRRGFLQDGPSLRDMRTQMRDDLVAVATALRAEPFDSEALRAAFETQNRRITARVEAGQKLMVDLILSMSAKDRADFADRLEQALDHHGRNDDDKRRK